MATMKIKNGDNVKVIAGKDVGVEGKVIAVDRKNGRVKVEGVNIVKKHQKPTQENQQGGIIEKEAPIDASNVMLWDPKAKKPTRVGVKVVETTDKNGKVTKTKIRVSKKSDYEFK